MKIRTVKPEFWQSEKLATRLSREARLMFIGLLNMADDHGRFRSHPHLVRGELFPYEPDAPVEAWLGELVGIGVVRLYRAGGQSYGVVVNFAEHQKIDRRWASRLPAPPVEPGEAEDHGDNRPPPDEPEPVTPRPAVHRASHAEDAAIEAPTEQAASVAAETASLPEQAASLANTTPTDRKGKEGKGTPSDARARAKGQKGQETPDPRPEQRPGKGGADPGTPIANLTDALFRTTLRAGPNAIRRRAALREIAERIAPTGIAPADVDALWVLAREVTTEDAGALLDKWLVKQPPGYWRDVLGEQAMKAEVAGGAANRARSRRDQADGIEGAEPQLAASAIEQVLQAVRQ